MPTKSAPDEIAAAAGQRQVGKQEIAGRERKSPYRGWVLLGLAVLAVAFWVGVGFAVWYMIHSSP